MSGGDATVEGGCPSRFCASQGGFCADFDESTNLPSGWTATSFDGTPSVGSSQYVSCPNSLEVSLPSHQNAPAPGVYASATTNALSTATLELDVYLPDGDSGDPCLFFGLQSGSDPPWGLLFYLSGGNDWRLTQKVGAPTVYLVPPPLTRAWNPMVLSMVFSPDATQGSATLTYEGVDLQTHTVTLQTATASSSTALPIGVVLGLLVQDNSSDISGTTVYFDNVRVH